MERYGSSWSKWLDAIYEITPMIAVTAILKNRAEKLGSVDDSIALRKDFDI